MHQIASISLIMETIYVPGTGWYAALQGETVGSSPKTGEERGLRVYGNRIRDSHIIDTCLQVFVCACVMWASVCDFVHECMCVSVCVCVCVCVCVRVRVPV